MLLNKTAEKFRAGLAESVSMPVRQSLVIAVFAAILAIVAVLIAVRK
jgi:hypothetical protein